LLGLAKDGKLSACGRQPTFPFILLSLYFCLFVCFALVLFSGQVSAIQVWGERSSTVHPNYITHSVLYFWSH
jgi:hypothetical protein